LAQCAPRFNGELNTGSCRIQTPFSTIASTEQPTEQCVHTVRLTSVLLGAASAAASALPMTPRGSWLANAPAPATRPERCKNARRSIVGTLAPTRGRKRGRAAGAFDSAPLSILVSSIIRPPPKKPFAQLCQTGLARPVTLTQPRL